VPTTRVPSAAELRELLRAAFWASLQVEEARPSVFALAFVQPDRLSDAMKFQGSWPLTPDNLAKLAPALRPKHRAVAVARDESGNLTVWGLVPRNSPALVVDVLGPAHLIVRYWYRNWLVLARGDADLLRQNLVPLIGVLGQFADAPSGRPRFTMGGVIAAGILRAARSQGHGGTILLVPAENDGWWERITSVRYKCSPPYLGLRKALETLSSPEGWLVMPGPEGLTPSLPDTIQAAADDAGWLTAVDGALVIDWQLRIHGFGAMIDTGKSLHDHTAALDDISVVDPEDAVTAEPAIRPIAYLGGARHRSAAAFCVGQPELAAIVCSQDGPVTFFGWLQSKGTLNAIRHLERYL